MIKRLILKLRKSIWIYPAFISTLSFFAAIGMGYLDSGIFIKLYEIAPSILLTSVDLSKNILTVIAGSLITMTTFTFSTTMVVLTTYSSQFSPRTVENFLSDDKTMKAMGVFMGGFVYSIMTLLFMRRSLGEQLVISSSLAILYAIVCLIEFIRYIQHVGSYIQTTNLINRLHDEAEDTIRDYKDLILEGDFVKDLGFIERDFKVKYTSKKSGYIQLISYTSLKRSLARIDGAIVLNCAHGDFVYSGSDLFTLIFKDEAKINESILDEISDAFTIGSEKSDIQDFNFSIQKISEIGLRAISPGINDPNTAISCIKILGVLLSSLNQFEKGYVAIKNEDMPGVLIFKSIDLSRELHTSFHQLIHYGKDDLSVMLTILGALTQIGVNASENSKIDLSRFFKYTFSKLNLESMPDYDKDLLEEARDKFKLVVS